MQATITNKYEGIDINALSKQELQSYKKNLECDISWIEHELSQLSNGDNCDEKLDQMNTCKKLLSKVISKV